jgi:arsenate reductase
VFRDIKQDPLTAEELEEMYQLSGSYEALFSKKAQLYKSMNLKDKSLTEEDYKKYILEHYTFFEPTCFCH